VGGGGAIAQNGHFPTPRLYREKTPRPVRQFSRSTQLYVTLCDILSPVPKTKTGTCTKCGKPVWIHSRGSLENPVCQPCRRLDPAKRPTQGLTRTQSLERARAAKRANQATLIEIRCPCGREFRAASGTTRTYCDQCRKERRQDHYRRKGAIRRAARWGVTPSPTGERITISELGERCSWTCARCGEFVNRDLAYPDPWMPSFGHIIPISRGGLDSWDNLRLEHLTCNVRAGNQ